MITNVSLVTVFCKDQQEAHDFYVDVLGMEPRKDISMGPFRWLTCGPKDQPELDLTFMVPGGGPMDPELVEAITRALDKGSMSGVGLTVDDCRATYDDLVAKGVDFLQPPSDRPYGVEAVMRDNSGNWVVLVEPREFSG
jgi:catechol 2,3-dioxygenase-like lactoylglutathione lyase family enzyme